MKLRHLTLTLLLGAGLAVGAVDPVLAKAPKALPSKHQAWNDAVTMLERTKKLLAADKAPDVNNHKKQALIYIQKAMQELRKATQGDNH